MDTKLIGCNMIEFLLAIIGGIVGGVIVFVVSHKQNRYRKKYFPNGITREGLEKMRISVSNEEYKNFLRNKSSAVEGQIIADKERGATLNQNMMEVLDLLRNELNKYP